MKGNKYIITEKEIDIDIKNITLLSIEECEKCRDIIPWVNDWWWLHSPSSNSDRFACANYKGIVNNYGCVICDSIIAVRPSLIYKSPDLQVGDKIKIVDYDWTVISDSKMLCDDIVGHTYFRKDWQSKDANDYEKSYVKVWLENWWKERAKE